MNVFQLPVDGDHAMPGPIRANIPASITDLPCCCFCRGLLRHCPDHLLTVHRMLKWKWTRSLRSSTQQCTTIPGEHQQWQSYVNATQLRSTIHAVQLW